MLPSIRIWLHWLKFSAPPRDRAQAPVRSRLLKALQPECGQTPPDIARPQWETSLERLKNLCKLSQLVSDRNGI